jgi:hypothetical protein
VEGITKFSFSKLMGILCLVEKEYIKSDRWLVKSEHGYFNLTERLKFLTHDPPATSFRSVFGPVISHSAVWYECNNENMSKAITRITCDPDEEHILGRKQHDFLSNPPRYARRYFNKLRNHFGFDLANFYRDWDESLLIYADLPHPKRKLRLQAALEIINNNYYSIQHGGEPTFITSVSTKFKKYEFARPGKYPRSIADLSVVGSLVCGWLVDHLKTSLSKFQYSTNLDIKYVKASTKAELRDVFQSINHAEQFYYAIHSDDGAGCVQLSDGRCKFTSDISTCDASHTGKLFELLLDLIPCHVTRGFLKRAVEQLKLPVKVMDASGRPCFKLKTNPLSVYNTTLFSGSILTTLINCIANTLIGLQLSRIPRNITSDDFKRLVPLYCSNVGYKVTFDICTNDQQLTFLSHFPTLSGGVALKRFTFWRTIGQCVGDIPVYTEKQIKIKDRFTKAKIMNSRLANGFIHCGDDDMIKTFRRKWNYSNQKTIPNYLLANMVTDSDARDTVTYMDLYNRYSLLFHEYQRGIYLVGMAELGDVVRSECFDKFALVDYQYSAPTSHDFRA